MKKFMLCGMALFLFEKAVYSADFTCGSGSTVCLRMSIRGADGIGSTIQRNMDSPGFRIFHVASEGNLTLDWLALTGGMSAFPAPGGGAILNRGTLAIHEAPTQTILLFKAWPAVQS
jgi:hypothetical protein